MRGGRARDACAGAPEACAAEECLLPDRKQPAGLRPLVLANISRRRGTGGVCYTAGICIAP